MEPGGGRCYDPASLLFLEVAATVDGYCDYASFCGDLEQADKGRRYRDLAGLDAAIPGQDSFSHFRKRVGHSIIDQTTAIMVQLFTDCGLIQGKILSTDGQLEPTHSRFKGCAYACQGCQDFAIDEASRQQLAEQLQSGSQHLEMICPFPEVVDKVRQATAKTGTPKDPQVALLEVEPLPPDQTASKSHPKLAALPGLPQDQLPPVRLKWSHLSLGPSGELRASCPKAPSDLQAGVGYHVDTKNGLFAPALSCSAEHERATPYNAILAPASPERLPKALTKGVDGAVRRWRWRWRLMSGPRYTGLERRFRRNPRHGLSATGQIPGIAGCDEPDPSVAAPATPLSGDGDREWQDTLVADEEGQESVVAEASELASRRGLLAEGMEALNERERHILAERRLNEQPKTLEDLSQIYGVSRERQIEARAFEKLQHAMLEVAANRSASDRPASWRLIPDPAASRWPPA